MSNYDHPSQRIGIQILLFVLSLIVISWPLLALSTPWTLKELLSFLFAIWTIGVVLLFVISRSAHHPTSSDMDSGRQASTNPLREQDDLDFRSRH
ncbi:MAG: hypothetical protein OQK12_02135 [Motiliproteus sp.]|nr:hypothetical protein [Motiliproteus sp.]MCW9053728.1 hypothetical protein [Motiliproteus sp.]